MTLPPPAFEVRAALSEALHRSNRRIGVITGGRESGGLYLAILTGAGDGDAAQSHALDLMTKALGELGLAELVALIEVGAVPSRPVLGGGLHSVEAPPPLAYRCTTLPDGRTLSAACVGSLGEWYAYVENARGACWPGEALLKSSTSCSSCRRARMSSGSTTPSGNWPAIRRVRAFASSAPAATPSPWSASPGTHAICEVCRWQDDRVQFRDPDDRGGANRVSLREARENFARYSKSNSERRGPTRAPRPGEQPPGAQALLMRRRGRSSVP